MTVSSTPIERFVAAIDPASNERGCWIYTGHRNRKGYGVVYIGGRACSAHRFAFELFRGPIEPGLCVCHSCDTPACVNPDHLWLGSIAANTADRDRKGRAAVGERASSARLTAEQVTEIRRLYATGTMSARRIAPLFGVGKAAVAAIVARRSWGHINDGYPARTPGYKHGLCDGERNAGTKLRAEDVAEIRGAHARGESQAGLARRYGVSHGTVQCIVERRNWKHLP